MAQQTFDKAKEKYQVHGVDVRKVLRTIKDIPISIHCWQLDDVAGFEEKNVSMEGGGILSTGGYPGKATNIGQLMRDLEEVLSLIPGKKKVNLHAMYGDFRGRHVERDKISPEDFAPWIEWAKKTGTGLDLNPTYFSHPLARSGYTLASADKKVRNFWIEHTRRTREISNYFGQELGITCIHNIWIPDGSKDLNISKLEHRKILEQSLDEIFATDYPETNMLDAIESKLFGIGIESYTVGSNEFYLGYAVKNGKLITLDTGHFHPTEFISDKISAVLPFVKGILLHLSRGIRWDSDHVTLLSEEIIAIIKEIIRAQVLDKVHIGIDYFDGSINRIGALVIGARAVAKALLIALLEPIDKLKAYEEEGNFFARLALLEDLKAMPFGEIWDYWCKINNIPSDFEWIDRVMEYEEKVLLKR